MFDITNFVDVFPTEGELPYDRSAQADIETRRRSFDGSLFIDRVLKALGVAKGLPMPG